MLEKIEKNEEVSMSPLTKMLFDLELEGEVRGEKRGRKLGMAEEIEKSQECV